MDSKEEEQKVSFPQPEIKNNKLKKFPMFLIFLLLLITLIGSGYYFYSQNRGISPFKNKTIPQEIISELPIESPDAKNIIPFSVLNDENYVLYGTFIKDRGAGKEYDYWIYNRDTKESINLSKSIKLNNEFINNYNNNSSYNNLFLSSNNLMLKNNPVFSVVDGWQVVGEYWVYDLQKNVFYYYPKEN